MKTKVITTIMLTLFLATFLATMLNVALVRATSTVPSIEWLPPLTKHEDFAFKDGSTLPIKFRLLDADGSFVMDQTVEVTVNDILFSDDFEAETVGSPAPKWSVETGTWLVEQEADGNKVYSQNESPTGRVTYAYLDGYTFRDGIIEARVKSISGTRGQHIAWRSDGGVNSNYYWFGWAFSSDRVRWGKFVEGVGTEVAAISRDFSSGVWYTLKVVASDSHFDMYLDGELIFSVDDTTFNEGSIGFHCGDHTHFDDVYVMEVPECASFSFDAGLETLFQYKLFGDSFEDATKTGMQWQPVTGPWAGTWAVELGEYSALCPSVYPGYAVSYMKDLLVSDFVLEFKTTILTTFTNGSDFAGVFFRTSSMEDVFGYSGAGPGYGYLAIIRANGRVDLYRSDGSTNTLIQGKTSTIDPTVDYVTFRVEAVGANIKVYVNGEKFIDANDSTYPSGFIALHPGRTHNHFDDISVLGYLYQSNLHTKELNMLIGNYMITVWLSVRSIQVGSHPFELVEGGKAKGKP